MSYTIGQLARLSGLPVKTIRFYSDIGVLPERGRTRGGYRLYGDEDRGRLELVRTLREIGVDLATIRSLGERDLGEVLSLHLRTVETQIRALQRTRAVLRATLERDEPTDDDLRRLNALGRLGAAETTKLVNEFVDDVAGENAARQEWLGGLRAAMVPELPDEPGIEQLDAWLELTELLGDDDFRAGLREMGGDFWENADRLDPAALIEADTLVTRTALDAVRDGVAPGSQAAAPVVAGIVAVLAEARGCAPEVIVRNYAEHDPRAGRYWELVAVVNGTPWPPESVVAHEWIAAAAASHLG
ncbi:MerR family transcriptional regulator [Streptosporangium sp. NPDC050855]|uniref:helix-turn-helix domain-containing protein n=1 Tax=Streptosporangium sp. NPDC050855 TaxID=3366194 RepID=UPI00378D4D96